MAVTVEFVTLGDASKQLGIPAPTLRLWTDELEKYEVHFVMRNQRDERIYYENDLEIFAQMKRLKDEYKRKLRTEDIAKMIYQQAVESDMFDLRRAEDAPRPEVQDKHLELLNNHDVEALFESHRVKQVMGYMRDELSKELRNEMDEKFMMQNKAIVEAHERLEKAVKEETKQIKEQIESREKQHNEFINEWRKANARPWWKKIFDFSD